VYLINGLTGFKYLLSTDGSRRGHVDMITWSTCHGNFRQTATMEAMQGKLTIQSRPSTGRFMTSAVDSSLFPHCDSGMSSRIFSKTLGPIFPPAAELRNTIMGGDAAIGEDAAGGSGSTPAPAAGGPMPSLFSVASLTLTSAFSSIAPQGRSGRVPSRRSCNMSYRGRGPLASKRTRLYTGGESHIDRVVCGDTYIKTGRTTTGQSSSITR